MSLVGKELNVVFTRFERHQTDDLFFTCPSLSQIRIWVIFSLGNRVSHLLPSLLTRSNIYLLRRRWRFTSDFYSSTHQFSEHTLHRPLSVRTSIILRRPKLTACSCTFCSARWQPSIPSSKTMYLTQNLGWPFFRPKGENVKYVICRSCLLFVWTVRAAGSAGDRFKHFMRLQTDYLLGLCLLLRQFSQNLISSMLNPATPSMLFRSKGMVLKWTNPIQTFVIENIEQLTDTCKALNCLQKHESQLRQR